MSKEKVNAGVSITEASSLSDEARARFQTRATEMAQPSPEDIKELKNIADGLIYFAERALSESPDVDRGETDAALRYSRTAYDRSDPSQLREGIAWLERLMLPGQPPRPPTAAEGVVSRDDASGRRILFELNHCYRRPTRAPPAQLSSSVFHLEDAAAWSLVLHLHSSHAPGGHRVEGDRRRC